MSRSDPFTHSQKMEHSLSMHDSGTGIPAEEGEARGVCMVATCESQILPLHCLLSHPRLYSTQIIEINPITPIHSTMPPKATTAKRPVAATKPSGAASGSARPGTTAARPRAGAGPAAGPSKPRIPQRAAASGSNVKPQVDVKPQVNVGEEEWARLMKETYGGKQSAEWYAKGAKSVEVSRVRSGRL